MRSLQIYEEACGKKSTEKNKGFFLQTKKKELPAIKQKDMDDVKMNSVIKKKKEKKN